MRKYIHTYILARTSTSTNGRNLLKDLLGDRSEFGFIPNKA